MVLLTESFYWFIALETTDTPLGAQILQPWCLIEVITRCINSGWIKYDDLPLRLRLLADGERPAITLTLGYQGRFSSLPPNKCGWPFKRGWGREKRTKRRKCRLAGCWIKRSSSRALSLICAVMWYLMRGESVRSSAGPQKVCSVTVSLLNQPHHPYFCPNFMNSATPPCNCYPFVQKWPCGHMRLQKGQSSSYLNCRF